MKFGGDWTNRKMEVVQKYAVAWLQIMKGHTYWTRLYFDALAGTGEIEAKNSEEKRLGMALRILALDSPVPFDEYYFVDKNEKNLDKLKSKVTKEFPSKKTHFKTEDCNIKLIDLANHLRSYKGKNYKILAFVDPFGMQVNWNTIVSLNVKGLDLWLLVPSGIGVNRLLLKNGEINERWMNKLENFLGLTDVEIKKLFYGKQPQLDIFEGQKDVKLTNPINRIIGVYCLRLGEIFENVSIPLPLKNSRGSTMFHFLLMSNNSNAVKIGNNIINDYL